MPKWTLYVSADGPYGDGSDGDAQALAAAFTQIISEAGHRVDHVSCISPESTAPPAHYVAVDAAPSPVVEPAPAADDEPTGGPRRRGGGADALSERRARTG